MNYFPEEKGDFRMKNLTQTQETHIKEVLEYFNEITGKHFEVEGESAEISRQFIYARMKEGYIVSDFKKIINNKFISWEGDIKMKKYIRPSTLFRKCHFEEYLHERGK